MFVPKIPKDAVCEKCKTKQNLVARIINPSAEKQRSGTITFRYICEACDKKE